MGIFVHILSSSNDMEQVYCTHCKNFRIYWVGVDEYIPQCKYVDECNLLDCEDSKSIEERPKYEEK